MTAKASVFEITTVKDPLFDEYMGMATGTHRDGTPLTLYTTDENGDLMTFKTPGQAYMQMQTLMHGLMSFRFRPASDITPKALFEETMKLVNFKPEDGDELA